MRKPKSISDDTKRAILEAAWDLITEAGQTDVSMTALAERAGVSRQTIFYAFGGRPGLLLAMVRHKDTLSDHVQRLRELTQRVGPGPEVLVEYADVWLDYLPLIYPVGILLDGASLNDPEAAAAWNDRMVRALLGGFRRLAHAVHKSHLLPGDPDELAETIWALVHPTAYRRLVEDCGWTAAKFRARQIDLIRMLLAGPAPSAA